MREEFDHGSNRKFAKQKINSNYEMLERFRRSFIALDMSANTNQQVKYGDDLMEFGKRTTRSIQ